jgi:hypothetical protein
MRFVLFLLVTVTILVMLGCTLYFASSWGGGEACETFTSCQLSENVVRAFEIECKENTQAMVALMKGTQDKMSSNSGYSEEHSKKKEEFQNPPPQSRPESGAQEGRDDATAPGAKENSNTTAAQKSCTELKQRSIRAIQNYNREYNLLIEAREKNAFDMNQVVKTINNSIESLSKNKKSHDNLAKKV